MCGIQACRTTHLSIFINFYGLRVIIVRVERGLRDIESQKSKILQFSIFVGYDVVSVLQTNNFLFEFKARFYAYLDSSNGVMLSI